MGKNSKIEWTNHTFNPWWGCTKVSPGCQLCYAERESHRRGHDVWGSGKPRRLLSDAHWGEPLRWDREAAEADVRYRVFCASMADVFDAEAPAAQQQRLWALIEATPNLDWQVLTKRPERIAECLPPAWLREPRPNVWLGTSIENADYTWRADALVRVPAAVHFLSVEPMIGPIPTLPLNDIEWVILGGESGPQARPMDLEWARDALMQCRQANVACFVKQLGGRKDKRRDPDEWPEDLRTREFPAAAACGPVPTPNHSSTERAQPAGCSGVSRKPAPQKEIGSMKRTTEPADDLFQVQRRSPETLQKAFEKLPEELREAADEIHGLYSDLTAEDAARRLKIGRIVADVIESTGYGKKGVKKIAVALGCSADKLYQCGRVAKAWPNGISELFVTGEEPRRMPVTWSHLVELTRAEGSRRDELLRKVQEEGLTVQLLRDEIGSPKRPRKPKADEVRDGQEPDTSAGGDALRQKAYGGDYEGTEDATRTSQPESDRMPQWLARILGRVSHRVAEDEQYIPELRKLLERGQQDQTQFDREAAWIEIEDLIRRRETANKEMAALLGEIRDLLRPAQAAA